MLFLLWLVSSKQFHILDYYSLAKNIVVPKSPAAESPQRNLTGPPRVIRDIIADLHNTIQNWNSQHIKGCTLVKQISSWKANEVKLYGPELEDLATQLSVVMSALRMNCDTLNLIQSQAEAFTKLPGLQNPVFFSLSAQDMSRLISDICMAYNEEIKVCVVICLLVKASLSLVLDEAVCIRKYTSFKKKR